MGNSLCYPFYGAVAVSILHEFDKDSVRFIVDHSDSKLFLPMKAFGAIWIRASTQGGDRIFAG